MLVSGVHPVAILSTVICSLLMFVYDTNGDHIVETPPQLLTPPQLHAAGVGPPYFGSVLKYRSCYGFVCGE